MLQQLSHRIAKHIPTHKVDIFGPDSMLNSAMPYYFLFFIIVSAFAIHYKTDNPYIVLFIIYSLIPLVDSLFSIDVRNPDKKETADLLRRGWEFELPILLTIAIDWVLFFYALNYYAQTELTLASSFKILGLVFIIFNVHASQFAVAHQIMHKPGWRRALGTVHMLKTLNMHFTYEHVFGHHRKVATPQDPASAEKGINVYQFFMRSYFGAYRSIYQMEVEAGKPIWKNAIIWSVIANFIFCGLILKFYGFQALGLFLLQVLGAVFYLQVINYIEHYGLRRKQLADGSYEKVTIRHSWNSPHRISNYIFFKLQRHSDHHENAMKPYQVLLTLDESPHLPHGYIVMTLIALFPQKFFQVMDPLVDHYNSTDNKTSQEMKAMYSKSIEDAKEFIVQISMVVCLLFVFSQFQI